MKSERYEMRVAGELMAAIDQQRGQLSRAAWITKVLEQALGDAKGPFDRSQGDLGSVPSSEGVRPPVPARASRELSDEYERAKRSVIDARRSANANEGLSEGTPLPKIAPRRQPR